MKKHFKNSFSLLNLEITMISTKFLVVLIFCISRTQSIDIKVKGDKCSNLDSCHASKEAFRTCSCDDDCYKYGTCCIDADTFALMSSHPQEYHCYDDRVMTPVFAKRTCSKQFDGNINDRTVCMETENDKVDVPNTLLVTSSKTKVTYWNRNCGICNNEKLADLTPWTVQVLCPDNHNSTPILQTTIRRHLSFDYNTEVWGLKIEDSFVNCSIIQYQPTDSFGKLKYCASSMVKSCPENHGDSTMHKHCSTYHGERKLKNSNVYFKNVHCALCNGASLKDLDCIGRNYRPMGGASLPNIVKVVLNAEDWEAVIKYKCSKNFDYDPFNAKCRKVVMKNSEDSEAIGSMAAKNIVKLLTLFISLLISHRILV